MMQQFKDSFNLSSKLSNINRVTSFSCHLLLLKKSISLKKYMENFNIFFEEISLMILVLQLKQVVRKY